MLTTVQRLATRALTLRGYESSFCRTDVGLMHVLDVEGRGRLPTVVLLHGLGAAAVYYAPLVEALRPHVRRILMPDLPGHGLSEAPPSGTSPRALAAAVSVALDSHLDEQAFIFGNSLGGLAAIRFAQAKPGRVFCLALCSPAGAPMSAATLTPFLREFQPRSHRAALHFVDRVFATRPALRQFYALGIRQSFARPSIGSLLRSVAPHDLLEASEVAALPERTLLVWGRGDRVLPRAHLRFFSEHLPRSAVVIEPTHVGHSPYLESVPWMARVLLDHLRRVSDAMPTRRSA